MPVSHLGLTVSHIPTATSFYLAALQPLGYRFIGHQGDSFGFGVDSADFFITQAPTGSLSPDLPRFTHGTNALRSSRPSPNHIAFLADSRLIVRECYAAALNAGALPSGTPQYRNEDCSCFNAAVEDLDGNTVEFIFRQPHGAAGCSGGSSVAQGARALSAPSDGADSPADDERDLDTFSRQTARSKPSLQAALDLASSTSKSARSAGLSPGISRSNTAPVKPDFRGKAILGAALGAAAGAALIFATKKEASKNAREEADHKSYMRNKQKSRHEVNSGRPPPPPRAETLPPSISPTYSPGARSFAQDRNVHRNYSTTESVYSRRTSRPRTRGVKMIEASGYNTDDDDIQEVMSRHTSMRPPPSRSRTIDQADLAPKSRALECIEYSSNRSDLYGAGRDAPRMRAPSSHGMKRSRTLPVQGVGRADYYIEAPSPKYTLSRQSSRRDGPQQSYSSNVGRHKDRRSSTDESQLSRNDSILSIRSTRPRRERDSEAGRRGSGSKASTIKPFRQMSRRESGDRTVPLPPPPPAPTSRAPSSCYYPAAISLPPSHASSRGAEREYSHAGSKATTYISAHQAPLEATQSKQSWEDFQGDESDGLGDIKTVLPDDSISCVDLTKPRHRRGSHHSRHSSRRSEASTVKPVKKEREESRLGKMEMPHRSKSNVFGLK